MVDVGGEFCIDRYEVSLVDAERGRALSPFYPPVRERTQKTFAVWQQQRATMGPPWARELALPEPPAWQLAEEFEPRAVVRENVLPNGYLSGKLAALACKNAGKRLCSEAEWLRACRGERDLPYPYGTAYQPRACNVARSSHPAGILHDNASVGHFDPRLNLTSDAEGPLLRRTGELPLCASHWGDDAIYDMVGNLDEWIDDPTGVFVGGFFSRGTQAGCAARIASHEYSYSDYSLGTRCCARAR